MALAARTELQFTVAAGNAFELPAGVAVFGRQPDGEIVTFETGTGLRDEATYRVDASWNELQPYWLDDRDVVVRCGSTSMYVVGTVNLTDRRVVIDTVAGPGEKPLREIVTVKHADPYVDPLFGTHATKLSWDSSEKLRFEHDLRHTTVRGNVVPATHGERHIEHFITSEDWNGRPPLLHDPPRAIVRTGPNDTLQFLYTLGLAPLAWLPDEHQHPMPELVLRELGTRAPEWTWYQKLLDTNPYDGAFTIDPMRYIAAASDPGFAEYDGSRGETIRFGDGTFGPIPPEGATFAVTYRVGGGTHGNVAADAIDRVDPDSAFAPLLLAVRNPHPTADGSDAESDESIRISAPQAFRERMYRAVRAEDYSRAATQELAWVQRAGTQFRWTGSWLSVFTAVDPRGTTEVPTMNIVELDRVLDRYRMAGYEAFGVPPRYASLDLSITVCARPDAFRGDVERAVLASLDGRTGLFAPDRFTFGTPLERSALEASVQEAAGVDGVLQIRYRRRGYTKDYVFMGDTVAVAADEIVRVENDPSRPDAGSVRVDVLGGR